MIRRALVLLGIWLAVASAWADTVRLVTGDDLPPYTGKKLPGNGMLTELVLRAFEQAGHQATLAWAPWKRGYELTRIGEFDATFPYARKPEREQDYLFSDLLYGGIRSVYARPDSGIDPLRIDTFRGRAYCAPIGFVVYPQVENLLRQGALALQRPSTMIACAKMLALGRVDFFITDAISGDRALRQAEVEPNVVRLEPPFDSAEFYLIVPKRRPDAGALIAEFNAGLKRLRSSGEYARIVRQHLK